MRIMRLARLVAPALLLAGLSMPAIALDTPGGGGGGGNNSSDSQASGPSMADARADIAAKHWEDAIAKLKLIIADNSSNADAYNLLGYAYRNLGDYKRAQQAYTRALKIDPNHAGALEYQGVLYVKLGEIDKAKANLEKIKGICGTDCEEYKDLAEAIPG